jgi:hypothetical protein
MVLDSFIPSMGFRSSELSRPHFGDCEDLREQLPTIVSVLRNMTRFEFVDYFLYPHVVKATYSFFTYRWHIIGFEPARLIDSLAKSVASLPRLTDLSIHASSVTMCNALIPLGLFSNLSKLSVQYGRYRIASFFISQMSTVIANSPRLTFLDVTYEGPSSHGVAIPKLSDLFSKLSANNPLYLEQLHLTSVDATLDQVTLPHLTMLTSFAFDVFDEDVFIVQTVWNSFLVNNIKLSDVGICREVSMETMLYLLSLSGLKSLRVGIMYPPPDMTGEDLENMLFEEVLPKHANSLEVLKLLFDYWVILLLFPLIYFTDQQH